MHVRLGWKTIVNDIKQTEKLQEWFDSLPEIVRQRVSANVLAFVFFVEVLKGKEKMKVLATMLSARVNTGLLKKVIEASNASQ
ncbi:hypothetical protein B6U96_13845 [Archaeoglobales archaeon ex4484_92]|nr:MAG: hypothetical protein B6U96_13845 [Archaeoglobales archaeon ex4484_92]